MRDCALVCVLCTCFVLVCMRVEICGLLTNLPLALCAKGVCGGGGMCVCVFVCEHERVGCLQTLFNVRDYVGR